MSSFAHLRRTAVILADTCVVFIALFFAFLLRFDLTLPAGFSAWFFPSLPYFLIAFFLSAYVFSLYRGIYHYSSLADVSNIIQAVAAAGILSGGAVLFALQGRFPRSILVLHPMLVFLGLCAVRFTIRIAKRRLKVAPYAIREERKILIVGAGDLGDLMIRNLFSSAEKAYRIVGFIDDDPSKWKMRLHGIPVLGGRDSIPKVIRERGVQEVLIAVGSRRGELVQAVVELLKNAEPRPELRIAPSLEELLGAPNEGFAPRKVKPADLLHRDVVRLDENRIRDFFKGKRVLVTGAGGTIGAELSRQVFRYAPAKIVLLENHATSLFYRESQLRALGAGAEVVPVLGDIRDRALVDRVFETHRPQIVLHAAAHKHVFQLETNIHEGVSNNILGTAVVAEAAEKFESECFLLVSTDKAVRPSSVMGATKRAAELTVRGYDERSKTRFCAVRFGNVLGSSGSVLRIFQEQIESGGPITVTDPEATRFFMTVEEAVGLILQSAAMARGGEVFILNMGTPVKIVELAKNLVHLSGLKPDEDIEIRFIGLRPGEKRDEELVEDSAGVRPTDHSEITKLRVGEDRVEDVQRDLREFERLCEKGREEGLIEKLSAWIPTFRPDARTAARSSSPVTQATHVGR